NESPRIWTGWKTKGVEAATPAAAATGETVAASVPRRKRRAAIGNGGPKERAHPMAINNASTARSRLRSRRNNFGRRAGWAAPITRTVKSAVRGASRAGAAAEVSTRLRDDAGGTRHWSPRGTKGHGARGR